MTGTMFGDVPRLLGGDHAPRLRDVPHRARRQAHSTRTSASCARCSREPGRSTSRWRTASSSCSSSLCVVIIAAKLVAARARDRRARRARARSPRRWLSSSSGRRCSPTARRRSRTPASLRGTGASARLGDLGRPHRLARADRAPGRAGARQRRVPLGHLGGRAQPLRLARRRRLPDLGLHAPLPAARPRRDAARGRAARRRLGGRRHGSRVQRHRRLAARPPRRPDAGRVRGPHARRRARGPLPLAGAPAQAARHAACCGCACRRSTRSTASRPARRSSRSACCRPASSSGSGASTRATSTCRWPSRWRSGRVYTVGLLLRREAGLRGRRFAVLLLAGFALVAIVLPLTHFAS